ncbi:hypothetical protein Tco_0996929 [Tanacetum coccineum]
MANLEFCDKHNKVAYLEKSEGSEEFHEIIDFLSASHIHYALTVNPTIYVSFIKQFWRTAAASTRANGELEDNGGVSNLPNSEIIEQLALMGYETDSDKLTFQKEEPVSMPNDSPLQSVHSLERDEGSMQQNELTNLLNKLTDRVAVLENDLKQTKKTYSTAFTKIILRVKRLENQVKTTKSRRRARIFVLEEENAAEDSSKQGRKISNIDKDPNISLIRTSDDTEVLLEEEEPIELVEDQGSGEKGEKEVTTADSALNTANLPISAASETPMVITAAKRIMYSRRREEKRKAKGKAIMQESRRKR